MLQPVDRQTAAIVRRRNGTAFNSREQLNGCAAAGRSGRCRRRPNCRLARLLRLLQFKFASCAPQLCLELLFAAAHAPCVGQREAHDTPTATRHRSACCRVAAETTHVARRSDKRSVLIGFARSGALLHCDNCFAVAELRQAPAVGAAARFFRTRGAATTSGAIRLVHHLFECVSILFLLCILLHAILSLFGKTARIG